MIVTPLLLFKETTQAHLLKISITHNKNLIPSLYLPITYISERSAPQILPLNEKWTLHLLNFLIIGL